MSEQDLHGNNFAVNIPLKTIEEAESPPPAYENPQIISAGWKNIGFTIAFWIHTLGVIVVALILGIPALKYYLELGTVDQFKQISFLFNTKPVLYSLCAVTVTGGLVSVIAFFLLRLCAGRIIISSFIFGIIIEILVCVVALIFAKWQLGITMSVILIITTAYFLIVRKRIAFAEAHLKVGCAALQSHPSLILIALLMLVVQLLWFVFWCMMVLGIQHTRDPPSISNIDTKLNATDTATVSLINISTRLIKTPYWSDTATEKSGYVADLLRRHVIKLGRGYVSMIITLALLYSFYWGALTFRNILQFTTACAVGHWWFPGDASRQYAIGTSLKRAYTTNFGTIAFGSLPVAIFKALRCCVNDHSRDQNIVSAFVARCAGCILHIIERLISYFNHWAFIYAALTGQDFIDSSRSFIQLAKERGWTMIINDDLVGNTLAILSIAVGTVTAAVGGIIFYAFTPNSSLRDNFSFKIAMISFILGISMSTIMTSILSSCVRTVFVCFALNPAVLGATHPEHLQNLVKTWHKFHPKEFTASDYDNKLPRSMAAENV